MKNTRIFPMVLVIVVMFPMGGRMSSARPVDGDDLVLDENVAVTYFEEMGYPIPGLLGNLQGDVVMRVKLDEQGNVILPTPISGPGRLVNDAMANAQKWQFRPNTQNAAVIIYEFRLANGSCGAALNQIFVFREPNIASVTACPTHPQPPAN